MQHNSKSLYSQSVIIIVLMMNPAFVKKRPNTILYLSAYQPLVKKSDMLNPKLLSELAAVEDNFYAATISELVYLSVAYSSMYWLVLSRLANPIYLLSV